MNYCTKCGSEVEGDESYCPECGTELNSTQSENIQKEPRREDTQEDDEFITDGQAIGITILLLVGITVVGMALVPTDDVETDQSPSGNTEDPLTQMETVFEGGYSRSRIKEIVDASLGTFDIPVNNENRRRAGNVALNLADSSNKNEMEILACVSATGPLEGEDYEDMTKWENYETVASGCALNT